jgi:hypothetical protein
MLRIGIGECTVFFFLPTYFYTPQLNMKNACLNSFSLCFSARVVLPLCGGNIDTTILGRCLDRGLACDGRLLKFSVTVSDRPGGIAELCRQMASIGISIKDIMHERAWIQSDIFSVEVTVYMQCV